MICCEETYPTKAACLQACTDFIKEHGGTVKVMGDYSMGVVKDGFVLLIARVERRNGRRRVLEVNHVA